MNRDLRDPAILGDMLLGAKIYFVKGTTLSEICQVYHPAAPDYSANPTCIEKYGRPQDLPSTLPN